MDESMRLNSVHQTGAQNVPLQSDSSVYDGGFPDPVENADRDPDYPFEEPEQAPELRFERSENLYSRSEPFWERVVELPREGEEYPRDPNYWNHPEVLADDRILHVDSGRLRDRVKRVLGSRALWIFLGVLVVLLAIWMLIYSTFLQIRRISVEGETSLSEQEIIAMSQLQVGMSTFDVDVEKVIERIERSGVLRCMLVDVAMDRITIHVRERLPAAYIEYNGELALLDERGWVLDAGNIGAEKTNKRILVKGFDVRRCSSGQPVTLETPARLTVYTQILIELRAMKGRDLICELDMTSMDSITLKTTDDFIVNLGNEKDIHKKLRAMMIVREEILRNGYCGPVTGGTIVVADPASPSYMPLGVQ